MTTYKNHGFVALLWDTVRLIETIEGDTGFVTDVGAKVLRRELLSALVSALESYPFDTICIEDKRLLSQRLVDEVTS